MKTLKQFLSESAKGSLAGTTKEFSEKKHGVIRDALESSISAIHQIGVRYPKAEEILNHLSKNDYSEVYANNSKEKLAQHLHEFGSEQKHSKRFSGIYREPNGYGYTVEG